MKFKEYRPGFVDISTPLIEQEFVQLRELLAVQRVITTEGYKQLKQRSYGESAELFVQLNDGKEFLLGFIERNKSTDLKLENVYIMLGTPRKPETKPLFCPNCGTSWHQTF